MEKSAMRLDMMSEKDLKQLYKNSAFLWWGGNFYLVLIIVACCSFCYLFKEYSGDVEFHKVIPLLTAVFIFINVFSLVAWYCFKYVRGITAHIFFFIQAVFWLLAGLIFVIEKSYFGCLFAVIGVLILIPTFSLKLIRAKRFSHKQIAAAWEKRKNGEILPDEDLPVKKQNRWLSMTCLIFAYLAMAMAMPWVFCAAILLIVLF